MMCWIFDCIPVSSSSHMLPGAAAAESGGGGLGVRGFLVLRGVPEHQSRGLPDYRKVVEDTDSVCRNRAKKFLIL